MAAIAISASDARFERMVNPAAPVVDSFEFRPGVTATIAHRRDRMEGVT
jgi:hypothetical protein